MHDLAGDIGGTNARFGSYVAGKRTGLVELPTADYSRDADLIDAALAALPSHAFGACCIAVAGPVFGAEARLTNADLEFSSRTLGAAVGGGRVALVNDMVALGTAVADLPSHRFELLSGSAGDGTKGVIAAGTGLGMGIVVGGRCLPSEGGHARVAPVGAFERELLEVTERATKDAVAWEHYLSGRGMVTLYEAVNAVWGAKPEALTAEQIIARGNSGGDPVCDTTLNTWAGLLATVAGGLAVTSLSLGGIYLAGSVAIAMAERLRAPLFRRRFEDAAWSADFLAEVPIHLVTDSYAGLDGAAIIAARTQAKT